MEEISSFIPRNIRKRKLPKPTIWEELLSWITSFAISLVILALFLVFVGKPFTVSGQSMYPTLHDSDRMFMSKLGDIKRFDIVVLQAPDQDKEYIKRVIGMPGDTIEVKDGKLYINGQVVDQPFINTELLMNKTVYIDDFTLQELTGELKVPEGKYFVMGDNRGVSKDSRMIGFIERSAIEGKAVFTIWPLNRIGGQTNYSYLYSE
ncbi:signal peptidase I [uncultured Granulicatella sp.]|uniref:signal peptidase I n=1 Tax=uncultured Granulicatella sp. TaxID=316089 RepID=UPI0028D416C1|nr:signal peptidase I [uncultured Granulicatella sp.]